MAPISRCCRASACSRHTSPDGCIASAAPMVQVESPLELETVTPKELARHLQGVRSVEFVWMRATAHLQPRLERGAVAAAAYVPL